MVLIFELLPEEISSFLQVASVRSTVVRIRETPRFLHVASSFRDLFPTFSQAYYTSSSPPLPLVWVLYLAFEKGLSPILPDFWCRVLWRLCLLLVDFMIAKTVEQIALFTLKEDCRTKEERLQAKMPAAIQPPRGHIFQITSALDDGQPLLAAAYIPVLTAQLYYASPITCISTGLFDSFQNVWCLLLLWSIHEMMFNVKKVPSLSLAALSLALAAYGRPWCVAFLVPICISQPSFKMANVFAMLFLLCALWLQVLSFLLVGTDAYWTWKPARALTPNLGPIWYFQMQLFDRFHDFFAIMFSGLPFLVVAPLTMRLHRYPMALVSYRSICC